MKINSLSKVLFDVIRKGQPSAREAAELANKFCKSNGRYRETLSAEMLPKDVKETLNMLGISNPSLITGYNSRSGSVVAGAKILDGRRTVGQVAIGFDKTRGSSPILQFRGNAFDTSRNEMAKMQFLMNPNASIDETVDIATAMSKRKGNINVHSEIGDAHYFDLMVNPERIESVIGKTIPVSRYSEGVLKSMYQSLQGADYMAEVQNAGKKFAELFSMSVGKQKTTMETLQKASERSETLGKIDRTVRKEVFAKKAVVKKAADDFVPKHEGKAVVSKDIIANKVLVKKAAIDVVKNKVYKSVSTSFINKQTSIPRVAEAVHIGPPVHYGKHKVKRYLYHITSEENYKKMLEDGKIHTSEDSHFLSEGVFMTELENLAKRWRTSKEWDELVPENKDGMVLSLGLLKHVSKNSKNVVCLRIPTKYMDHDALKIRSQNKLINSEQEAFRTHISQGAPAKDASLYKQRKEAIEYIYQHDIPIDQVEFVGMSEIPQIDETAFQTWSAGKQKDAVKNFFLTIFKGQPEAKGIETMM